MRVDRLDQEPTSAAQESGSRPHHPASNRLDIWEYRRQFLQAAQRTVPGFGSFLQERVELLEDENPRTAVIRDWQDRFHLHPSWAFHCAKLTLLVWDRFPESRSSFQWSAGPQVSNLAAGGLHRFTLKLDREYYPSLDFGWFKQSLHGALEAELERFGEAIGANDLGLRRRPKDLERAFECLALRVCERNSPAQISSRPEYSRDWTTLSRDLTSAAKIIRLGPPRRGRPRKPAP